ncbi:hypothetical protein LguiA_030004 [Lonicera macranthoides]
MKMVGRTNGRTGDSYCEPSGPSPCCEGWGAYETGGPSACCKGWGGCEVSGAYEGCCCRCRARVNKGYAFVNLTNPKTVWRFCNACDRMKWDLFEAPKIREIVSAKLQKVLRLISRFLEFPEIWVLD